MNLIAPQIVSLIKWPRGKSEPLENRTPQIRLIASSGFCACVDVPGSLGGRNEAVSIRAFYGCAALPTVFVPTPLWIIGKGRKAKKTDKFYRLPYASSSPPSPTNSCSIYFMQSLLFFPHCAFECQKKYQEEVLESRVSVGELTIQLLQPSLGTAWQMTDGVGSVKGVLGEGGEGDVLGVVFGIPADLPN